MYPMDIARGLGRSTWPRFPAALRGLSYLSADLAAQRDRRPTDYARAYLVELAGRILGETLERGLPSTGAHVRVPALAPTPRRERRHATRLFDFGSDP